MNLAVNAYDELSQKVHTFPPCPRCHTRGLVCNAPPIEVLRDGASAQYGSDAIAGVINLRLRDANDGGDATVTYGMRESSYETNTAAPPAGAGWSAPARLQRDVSDGETLTVSAWKGLPLGPDGFVTLAAEYKDQERTERGGWDHRRQYPLVAPGTSRCPPRSTRPATHPSPTIRRSAGPDASCMAASG